MVAAWLIAGIVVVVLFLLVFKSQDAIFLLTLVKKNLFYVVIIGVILVFVFSLFHIRSTYEVDLGTYEGLITAGNVYFVWLKSVFGNVGEITGYAVEQDWWFNGTAQGG